MAQVTVYLVGAGPGDPNLLTVRAAELLAHADCVIYDYLASSEILALASSAAERVYVGKKGFAKHIGQDGINELLLQKAQEYARLGSSKDHYSIVRLKGGDPFVFGRGGEEALSLGQAGIVFEVVPGITSGVAAPAYAGIPVTHRGIASSVTFVTGNEDPTKESSDIDWSALSALVQAGGTVCFYMGVRNLEHICAQLESCGVPNEIPVALVEWGTTAKQRVVTSTLGSAPADAEAQGIQAPAMIVVGKVVQLSDSLSWWTAPPLAGKRILVTRASTQAGRISSRLRELGALPVEVPLIAFEPPSNSDALTQALRHIQSFDWVVFTSANGVSWFFDTLACAQVQQGDARCLAHAQVAAIGPATAQELAKHGIAADVVPQEYIAEAVFESMRSAGLTEGQKVLIPRAEEAREVLPELLSQAGADVCVAPAYRCVIPEQTAGYLRAAFEEGIDATVFTSSSTARNFFQAADACGLEYESAWQAFSIGPITTETLRQFEWQRICQAQEYTIDGLIEAMISFYTTEEN